MTTRKLDIEIDTGGELDERHPARRMFAGDGAGRKKAAKKAGGKKAAKKGSKAARRSSVKPGTAAKPGKAGAAKAGADGVFASLSKGDRKVIEYLDELKRKNRRELPEGGDCVASIPEIAEACEMSMRQVQNCTQRLIDKGLLRRVTYDFSNPDRSKRGTIFKVLL